MSKIILGIETSCDETAAAVLIEENGRIQILSNVVASSALLQSKYGGIIPEQAAREQLKSIIPVITEALEQAGKKPGDLDAIAVTFGPGLIGSLLVGVETAKVLAKVWDKPLIPINHLIGHFYANWISNTNFLDLPLPLGEGRGEGLKVKTPEIASSGRSLDPPRNDGSGVPSFPCIGLLVSGGHSDLVLFKNHGEFEYLGGTRDDAAGECFDKAARILGLPYPGGPAISKLAAKGNPKAFNLPRPMWDSTDYDFSFSGLKTAIANLVSSEEISDKNLPDLCASIQQAIIDSLIKKTVLAAKINNIEQIIVAGGVAANQELVRQLREQFKGKILLRAKRGVIVPPPALCTDNAAMIAAAAFFIEPTKEPLNLQANPNLSLAY